MEQLSLFDAPLTAKEELIEKLALCGSGVCDGMKRIYEFAKTHPTHAQMADFLKDEYGWGGFASPSRAPNYVHNEMHDPNGIRYRGTDRDGNEVEGEMNWVDFARVIIRMVADGRYKP